MSAKALTIVGKAARGVAVYSVLAAAGKVRSKYLEAEKMRFALLVGFLILLRTGLFWFFVVSRGEYYSPDTGLYVQLADNLLKNHVFSLSPSAPFVPDIFRTPGYPAFLALIKLLGLHSPYWVVFFQEIIYAGCVWMFFGLGKPVFGEKIAKIGVIFMLLETGGLTYPKLLLSETLFLPFVLGTVLVIGLYLRDARWRYMVIAGAVMGFGALVRPAILYLPLVIAVTLIVFAYRNARRWLHAGVLLLSFLVVIAPWMARNYHHFGKIMMTGQQSNMFINYHVPLVWESAKGIHFNKGWEIIHERVDRAVTAREKSIGRPLSMGERFELQQGMALQELFRYPGEYAKQWLYGILKTMNGVNLTEFYHAFRLDTGRLHFFQVEATDFVEKVTIFLKHQDIVVLLAVFLRVMISGFALLGVLQILSRRDCLLWIMMLVNFYFICVPGPMGYSRFRFPVEVFWFIQAYLGWLWFAGLLWQKRRLEGTNVDTGGSLAEM